MEQGFTKLGNSDLIYNINKAYDSTFYTNLVNRLESLQGQIKSYLFDMVKSNNI